MEFLYFLESIRTPIGDAFFSTVTHLGEETLFIVAGLLVFWCVNKMEGYYLLTVGLSGTVINQFLKMWFRIPRPWVKDPNFTIVESARAEATGYSFPSGHTQSSVGIFGALTKWNRESIVRFVCILICILVPLSRLYLGVHTPADVGVSIAVALVLILGIYPMIQKSVNDPKYMRILMGSMLLGSILFVLFVEFYPFPADMDPHNMTSGTKNAYTMLGSILGVWLTYEVDHRRLHFETDGALPAQICKLVCGLAILLGVKAGLKAPLYAVCGGHYIADMIRYFLMVAFAGCIWPRTFPFWKKIAARMPR